VVHMALRGKWDSQGFYSCGLGHGADPQSRRSTCSNDLVYVLRVDVCIDLWQISRHSARSSSMAHTLELRLGVDVY
jgi:hypothetical protein